MFLYICLSVCLSVASFLPSHVCLLTAPTCLLPHKIQNENNKNNHLQQKDYIHGMPRAPHDARFPGTWRALTELQASGTIRLLGISNFNAAQIEQMVRDYPASPPQVRSKR
jgi:diketogulonate reductase-like aldo/keto reductase